MQSPPSGFFGTWTYPIIRDHTDLEFTPNYGDEPIRYAATTLDLGDRSAKSVWEILDDAHEEFTSKGADIDYDFLKNSNSYVTSLLSLVGIDINDSIAGATATGVNSFPGIGVNVLNIEGDAFSLDLSGGEENDIFHTGIRNDDIKGKAGNDYIDTGEGNDRLDGGIDDDELIGGNGLDTYVVDGNDHIIDSDGKGVVLDKNGNSIIGAFMQQADGSYTFVTDNSISATKNSPLTLHLADGSTAVIENHANNGDFGIFLVDERGSISPIIDNVIIGDVDDGSHYGRFANDLIQSLGGDDYVYGRAGEDRIEGGSGQDYLFGGLDDDVVVGGEDSDIIRGDTDENVVTGNDNDRLYAEAEYTIDEAYALGKTQPSSGQRGDLLSGGIGDDTLIGEAGEDILLGGMGKDIIVGMGGNDNIEGDNSLVYADHSWDVTNTPTPNTEGGTTYVSSYNFNVTDIGTDPGTGAGDADVIYGGAGND